MSTKGLRTKFYESGYYGASGQQQAWVVDLLDYIDKLEERIVKLEENSHEPVDVKELIRSELVSYGVIAGSAEDE